MLLGLLTVYIWTGGSLTAVGWLNMSALICCILPGFPIAGFSSCPDEFDQEFSNHPFYRPPELVLLCERGKEGSSLGQTCSGFSARSCTYVRSSSWHRSARAREPESSPSVWRICHICTMQWHPLYSCCLTEVVVPRSLYSSCYNFFDLLCSSLSLRDTRVRPEPIDSLCIVLPP